MAADSNYLWHNRFTNLTRLVLRDDWYRVNTESGHVVRAVDALMCIPSTQARALEMLEFIYSLPQHHALPYAQVMRLKGHYAWEFYLANRSLAEVKDSAGKCPKESAECPKESAECPKESAERPKESAKECPKESAKECPKEGLPKWNIVFPNFKLYLADSAPQPGGIRDYCDTLMDMSPTREHALEMLEFLDHLSCSDLSKMGSKNFRRIKGYFTSVLYDANCLIAPTKAPAVELVKEPCPYREICLQKLILALSDKMDQCELANVISYSHMILELVKTTELSRSIREDMIQAFYEKLASPLGATQSLEYAKIIRALIEKL